MPQENAKEIVHQAHEAFSRGDREAFVALWAEECEYQPARDFSDRDRALEAAGLLNGS